jgi:hypothetical protein
MPIYEFERKGRREVFETVRSVSGGRPVSCPAWGSKKISKLISTFGIARPGIRIGSLSPAEEARAEKEIQKRSRGRCCDTFCDPRN